MRRRKEVRGERGKVRGRENADFCVFLSFVVPTTGEDDEISSFQFEHNTID
jgi:hypothetical protein